MSNGNETVQLKENISSHLPPSLSDQFYRQSKIDEENRRLKKKSKSEGKSKKKSSKKSDLTTVDDNDDDDLYPSIKVTRGGELPEGITESGNEDNTDEFIGRKNQKIDPHRALNIDLNEKSVVPQPPPPLPPVEQPKAPSPPVEKTKKLKKKKPKEEEKLPPPAPTIEEKPKKKKKIKTVPSPSTDINTPAPLLLDIMNDDLSAINSSDQQSNGHDVFQFVAQSDHLILVSHIIDHLHDIL